MTTTKPSFLHERLLAYPCLREFYCTARTITRKLPLGLTDLGDQLTRAARSSCLAIADGGELSASVRGQQEGTGVGAPR